MRRRDHRWKGPPAVESSGERRLGGVEHIGVRRVPSRAHAPPEDPIFLAKQRRRSETQGAHRLVHQKAFDVDEAFGALNILTDGAEPFLRAAEVPVEQSVHKFGGPFVRARDEKDENGGDRHPGPVRQARPFVDRAQFFMDEKRRRAEQEAEHGRAAQRDPDADHGRAAHRLHDKDAQIPLTR